MLHVCPLLTIIADVLDTMSIPLLLLTVVIPKVLQYLTVFIFNDSCCCDDCVLIHLHQCEHHHSLCSYLLAIILHACLSMWDGKGKVWVVACACMRRLTVLTCFCKSSLFNCACVYIVQGLMLGWWRGTNIAEQIWLLFSFFTWW